VSGPYFWRASLDCFLSKSLKRSPCKFGTRLAAIVVRGSHWKPHTKLLLSVICNRVYSCPPSDPTAGSSHWEQNPQKWYPKDPFSTVLVIIPLMMADTRSWSDSPARPRISRDRVSRLPADITDFQSPLLPLELYSCHAQVVD